MSLKRRIEKLEHQQRGDESLTFTWQEFLHALCTLDRKWCKRRAKEPGGRTALIAMLLLKWLPHLSKAGWSLSNLASLLRRNLFTYRDLQKWLDDPFQTPPLIPPPQQLSLALGCFGQQ